MRAQVRNTTAFVPSAIDPRVPLARTALTKPSRYTLRPNFETAFNAVKVEMSRRAGASYVFYAPAIKKGARPNSEAGPHNRAAWLSNMARKDWLSGRILRK